MTNKAPKQNLPLGLTYGVLGALSVTFIGLFVNLLGPHFPNSISLTVRFFISLLFICCTILLDRNFTWRLKKPAWVIGRTVFGVLAMACFFMSIQHMPIANAVLLVQTAPIYVPIFVLVLMRISTHAGVWWGILVAFFGVVIVLHPDHHIWSWVALIGLASGVCNAVASVCLRAATADHSTNQILFYYFLIATIACGIVMCFNWQTPTHQQWGYLIGLGISGTAFQVFWAVALRYASVRILSPTMLTSIIFGGMADWAFWGILPSWNLWCGAVVLILGLAIILWQSKKGLMGGAGR